jgi:hypothetical protein
VHVAILSNPGTPFLRPIQIFPGEAGLPGASLLSRFKVVTIDAVTKRLFLKK